MPEWVGGRGVGCECSVRTGLKLILVQILVEVANIQMRFLKTEVEKGSMWTAIEHGLVGPKAMGKPNHGAYSVGDRRKGIRLTILN